MLTGKGLLTPLQREFLALFATLPDHDRFALTGGTALAEYYYAHRRSDDLEFVTGQSGLILPVCQQIEERCAALGRGANVVWRFWTSAEIWISNAGARLKVDLAFDPIPALETPEVSEQSVYVRRLLDVTLQRLLAYYTRTEPRSAVDLYWIMRQGQLHPLLEQAAQKDPALSLHWMTVTLDRIADFPDEQEQWPVQMLQPFDPPELKQRFRALAREIMDRLART